MRTLSVRVKRAGATAMAVARHFDGHPKVVEACYPGLPGFAGHETAARQMSGGFGGMLSLRVAGGAPGALAAIKRTNLFVRATLLGGVERLIAPRAPIDGPPNPAPKENTTRRGT